MRLTRVQIDEVLTELYLPEISVGVEVVVAIAGAT